MVVIVGCLERTLLILVALHDGTLLGMVILGVEPGQLIVQVGNLVLVFLNGLLVVGDQLKLQGRGSGRSRLGTALAHS
jgi:hypothetical protein